MEFDFTENPPSTRKKKKSGNICFLCHKECVSSEKITELVLNNINKNAED